MAGIVSATPDGKTRIHPAQMKMERLPVNGLLKLFFGPTDPFEFFPDAHYNVQLVAGCSKTTSSGPEGLYAGLQ